MRDVPPDPFQPGDAGSIAVVTLYHGLRRAGAGMIESALIVAAQVAVVSLVTQEQQENPPQA